MQRIKNILIALLAMLTLASCHRINLYEPDGGLYIDFEIDFTLHVDLAGDVDLEANPAMKEKALGKMPDLIHVLFYDPQTHAQVYEDYLPPKGGFVRIDPGYYDVIAYGLGTEVTKVSEDLHNRGLGKAYTSVKQSSSDLTKAETPSGSVIEEPDQLYSGSVENMEVPVHDRDQQIIHLHMNLEPLVESWTFIAYNISGLQWVKSLTVRMTAQAPDRYLWDGHRTVRPVNIEFPAIVNPETYSIKTVFNTFGKLPEFEGDAVLEVEVGTASGRYRWQYDVTDQWDNPDNTQHLIIVTEHIDIPDPGQGGDGNAGFGPSVNPWQGEVIDIPIS